VIIVVLPVLFLFGELKWGLSAHASAFLAVHRQMEMLEHRARQSEFGERVCHIRFKVFFSAFSFGRLN
jgi:hypothetical protein